MCHIALIPSMQLCTLHAEGCMRSHSIAASSASVNNIVTYARQVYVRCLYIWHLASPASEASSYFCLVLRHMLLLSTL